MKETENCLHCNDDYIPKRRGVQKFCSASCRSRYWFLHQDKKEVVEIEKLPNPKPFDRKMVKKLDKIDKNIKKVSENKPKKEVTLAGTGESFFGAAAANALTHLLTDPPTRRDINELKTLIKGARYFPVNNLGPNIYGEYPFYDIETGNIEYFIPE